jgi:hypothetical protein
MSKKQYRVIRGFQGVAQVDSISITDPVLKQAILFHLINQIDSGGIDKLLENGVSPDFIDDLRKRQARDLGRAVLHPDVRMAVHIDTKHVMSCLTRIDRQRQDSALMEYFIVNGASAGMMHALFKISKAELANTRADLNAAGRVQNGRTKLPPESVRDDIHHDWESILKKNPNAIIRERLYLLHQRYPEYSINSVCAAIKEFNDLLASN